jgi:Beta-lactamase class C and other penicillin binding proteins
MATIVRKLTDIQANLDALARQHRVPGASLGILNGDEFLELATGVVNKNTGVPTTPDTLFQIGSNTKVYNATLVMQLVDEGLVDLDSPVRKYVPELKLADEQAAEQISVRMLLTHTSGMQGDYFDEFGRGDDCLERYVASFETLTQIHEPDKLFSYCNSGFCLAGRVIEKVTGKWWHEVLREKLFAPLGCRATTVLLEEMVAHRYAVGHVGAPGATELSVPPRVMMSRAHAASGSLTSSTPREVLNRFVRFHLDDGRGPDGSRLLSAASVRAMQEPQFSMPGAVGLARQVGLSWMLNEWSGERVIGHGGGTIGQLSFLQVLPDRRFGVCLLTNSATGGALWRDLGTWLFEELAGVQMPAVAKPAAKPPALDLAKYTGKFERLGVSQEITVEDGELVMVMCQTGPLADPNAPPQKLRLQPIDKESFYSRGPAGEMLVGFLEFDADGRPTYTHIGGRAARRVSGKETRTAKRARASGDGARARSGRRA